MTDAIGNQTFYMMLIRWPRENKLFTHEGSLMESIADVIDAIDDLPIIATVMTVFEHSYDCPRRDVTQDVAREMLKELRPSLEGIESAAIPSFIERHLSADEIEAA